MSLSASGLPLHSRTLSVTLTQAEPPRVAFAAYVLDLRKRGIAPVGGDLQGPGVIHHMLLDGVIDRATGRLDTIGARMPAVAFEASPATGAESCRDLIGRVDHLAGVPLDGGYARTLGSEIGGPRGCSHILTLAHLLGPTAGWAFAADARLHRGVPARRLGERIFRRDITVDGYETAPGELALTLQLNDLLFAPAPALARAMDRFAAQTEITARATLAMKDLLLGELQISERRRSAAEISQAEWRERSDAAAALVGQSLRSGISGAILGHFAAAPDDAPLRDALLQLAPTLVQCFAALDIWSMASTGGTATAADIGGLPDSCWMWRRGGALGRTVRED
jgi:DUF2889 family protein